MSTQTEAPPVLAGAENTLEHFLAGQPAGARPAHLAPSKIDQIRSIVTDRFTQIPPWLLVTQLFIGMGWLRAATEKAIDSTWWSGVYLDAFLIEHEATAVGWYQPFANIVASMLVPVSLLVMVLQLGVGISLVTGRKVPAALALGMFMNLNFVAMGAVDPSAFYLLSQGAVALWLFEESRRPDRYLVLWGAAVVGGALVLLSLPFIATLHPAEVIEDPAIMLVTGGLLTLLAADISHRRATGRGLP